MRVALVTPWDKRGGIADYSERFTEELRDRGVSVTPVPIKHESATNPRRFVRILSDVPDDTDIVHTQFEAGVFGQLGMTGSAAPLYFHALGKMGPQAVTTLHEVHSSHAHCRLPGDLLLRARDTLIERMALANSDKIIVHTEHAVDVLGRRHGTVQDVERLLHPVETNASPMNQTEAKIQLGYDSPLIVTFGWVEEKKRYADVLAAMDRLPDVQYLIAGEPRSDADEQYLKRTLAKAERMGLADRVDHIGYVPEPDIPVVFSAADAVVVPYNRVAQSGVINRALAYQRPIVASRLPAFEELKTEFDCLLTYSDIAELVDQVRSAMFEERVRSRLNSAAKTYIETATWEKFAADTIDIYRSLIDPAVDG